MSDTIWVAMYAALTAANLFFAFLALLELRPFLARWQIVLWHTFLAVECAGAGLFINKRYEIELFRLVLRLAWGAVLVIALIIIVQWIKRGLLHRNT